MRRLGRSRARARPSASLSQDRCRRSASSNAAIATAASCSSGDLRTTRRHEPAPTPGIFSIAASIPTARGGLRRGNLAACDDGELYLQYSASEAFGFDDGRLKTADFHTSSGFGLRGVTGETTAFAHANEISEAAIERAAATLKLLDPAKGPPAAPPQRTNQAMYGADDPLSLMPFAREGRLVRADRRRGPGSRPARRPGQRRRWRRAGA